MPWTKEKWKKYNREYLEKNRERINFNRRKRGRIRRPVDPIYTAWANMKTRCYNKNYYLYHNYGGRGIVVCDEWRNGFRKFREDMGDRPDGKSLDRINVNGNYCKENCRWATAEQQASNTRLNRWIKYNGEVKTLTQWIDILGLKRSTVYQRYYGLKWDINKCFNYSR